MSRPPRRRPDGVSPACVRLAAVLIAIACWAGVVASLLASR